MSIIKYFLQMLHSLPNGVTSSADRRRWHERSGRLAEFVAASLLIFKGYRILARRQRTPYGELDLIAVRGKRVAFVEVKLRRHIREAEAAIGQRQAGRMARAAEHWIWRHRRYRASQIGMDAIYLARNALPRHVCDIL
ncbi:MAG: YraN family protein [Pseudomonadota bacterium]